jgi:hypothetical protein
MIEEKREDRRSKFTFFSIFDLESATIALQKKVPQGNSST